MSLYRYLSIDVNEVVWRIQGESLVEGIALGKSPSWTFRAEPDDRNGVDAAQWIFEGLKGGEYHIVDRWSPENGEVHSLGIMMLIDLAKKLLKGGDYTQNHSVMSLHGPAAHLLT